MTQFKWDNYLLGQEYQYDIVLECITQIGEKIFGKDHAGSNAYIHLCRQLCKFKIRLHKGVQKWEVHIQDYQKCLLYCPWVSGEHLEKLKLQQNEQELKEILQTAVLTIQCVKLNKIE